MKNVTELRTVLAKTYEELKANKLDVSQVKAIVATTNSMLKSVQLEMEHCKMTGDKGPINFLKG